MNAEIPPYREHLQTELKRRCLVNPSYSVRAYARALAINSGALSQILSGKRIPSLRTAKKLMNRLDLAPELQDEFMDSLGTVQTKRGLKRMNAIFKESVARPKHSDLSLERFRAISDWYHFAIMEATRTEGFNPNPRAVALQLQIPVLEAKQAISRLKALGLLTQTEDRKLTKTDARISTADKHTTEPALKHHQRQMLEKAILSLQKDPIEVRNMVGMTMAIDPRKIPVARKRIQIFMRELCEYLETGKRTRVYQFQNALFPLDIERKTK